MTDNALKVQENRCRRMARRQGLELVKVRRRDPHATNYGAYRLLAVDEDDQTGEGLFTYSKSRRSRETFNYGRNEVPRASALTTAFLAHDPVEIHALGPAMPDEFVPGWLDPLEYPPNQREANPDHDLIFGQIHLLVKLARECGMKPAALYEFLERQRTINPDAEDDDQEPGAEDGLRVVAVGNLAEIEDILNRGAAKVR